MSLTNKPDYMSLSPRILDEKREPTSEKKKSSVLHTHRLTDTDTQRRHMVRQPPPHT